MDIEGLSFLIYCSPYFKLKVEKTENFFNNSIKLATKPIFTFKLKNLKEISVFSGVKVEEGKIIELEKDLRKKLGKHTERRNADWTYNCHGLTFINKLGWIGLEDIFKEKVLIVPGQKEEVDESELVDIEDMLTGNGLRLIKRFNNMYEDKFNGDEDVKEGDIAIYKSIRNMQEEIYHSGIIFRLCILNNKLDNVIVLSKFGHGGEYFHPLQSVGKMYDAEIAEIWTDR